MVPWLETIHGCQPLTRALGLGVQKMVFFFDLLVFWVCFQHCFFSGDEVFFILN